MFDTCGTALREEASSVEYSTENHPLPITAQESLTIQVILSIFASLLMLIPLCYLPSSFIPFIVRERVSLSKHLQFISSVSPNVYWLATYIYDLSLFLLLILCVFIALLSYGRDATQAFMSDVNSSIVLFLLLLSYGASIIPLCYLYSFLFNNSSTAQITIMTWNFFTGFVAVLAYFIMTNIRSTRALGETLVHIFRLFPTYNVGEGLINISANYYYNEILGRNTSYWAWEIAGRDITFMTIEAVGYLLLVLVTDAPWFLEFVRFFEKKRAFKAYKRLCGNSFGQNSDIETDVAAESVKCEQSNPDDFTIMLVNVEKIYPPSTFRGVAKHAVKHFNLGCPEGERFGLLGTLKNHFVFAI